MFRLSASDHSAHRNWTAAIVLLAVTAITVSVATRYVSVPGISSHTTAAHKHSAPERAKQRLIKYAANWMPPVASAVMIEPPSPYPRIAPAGPPIPRLVFLKNLYNRPPPFLNPYLLNICS
jgi:hypothetical protein